MLFKVSSSDGDLNSLEPMPFRSVSHFDKLEKDLEILIAENLLDVLFGESPLLPIFQERKLQAEADIYALNRNGDLVIFELKRGAASSDAVIQLMRYAQDCGNWSYKKIERKFRQYSNSEDSLAEIHKNEFNLDRPLKPLEFNRDQHLIIIGNASNSELIHSVDYWKEKGISIQFVPYRLYQISDDIYFELFAHPYDKHHNPAKIKGVIFDTNKSYGDHYVWHMFENKRVSAFGDIKGVIGYLSPKDFVFYSHKGLGIIAAAKVQGPVKSEGDNENYRDVEFLTPVPEQEDGIKNYISFSEVSSLLDQSFFWARTIKSPYLSKNDSEILLQELKDRMGAI